MASCNNVFFLAHLIENSGMLDGAWQAVLLGGDYTPSCTRIVTDAMFPDECVFGRAAFAVSFDRDNVCVTIAQDKIIFQSSAELAKDVTHIALMTPQGLMAAAYGRDLIQSMVKDSDQGQDLILTVGEDRSIWGI